MRYWSLTELKEVFDGLIGDTTIQVDCYFGLGLQKADIDYMHPKLRLLINLSEILRKISEKLRLLTYTDDNVYVKSFKTIRQGDAPDCYYATIHGDR